MDDWGGFELFEKLGRFESKVGRKKEEEKDNVHIIHMDIGGRLQGQIVSTKKWCRDGPTTSGRTINGL